VVEDGSDIAEELWLRASLRIGSWLVYAEARAAIAAATRGGRLERRESRQAANDLEAACAAMRLIGVDRRLSREAGELAERHALRGYDAVHLASALSVDDEGLVLVTWDHDLARATLDAGRAVVPGL
jgi:predicted nucleic acid-binding protein